MYMIQIILQEQIQPRGIPANSEVALRHSSMPQRSGGQMDTKVLDSITERRGKVEALFQLLEDQGKGDYIGEKISQLVVLSSGCQL